MYLILLLLLCLAVLNNASVPKINNVDLDFQYAVVFICISYPSAQHSWQICSSHDGQPSLAQLLYGFFFLRSELTFLPSASTAPLLFLKHILQIRNASLQINLLVGTVVCLHPGVVVLDKDCACLLSSMANPICESIQTKKHFPHSQGSQPFFRIHWGGGSFKSVHSFLMA